MYFLINEKVAKKYKVHEDDLGDHVIDYIGYEEINTEFSRRGLPEYTRDEMEAIRKIIWKEHDNYDVPKLIDYLVEKGVI